MAGDIYLDNNKLANNESVLYASGKTVNSSYLLKAQANDGYYFQRLEKTTNPTEIQYNNEYTYTIKEADAYNATIWWDAHFYQISTSNKEVAYSGNVVSVDAPTGLPTGFSVEYRYTKNGTSVNSPRDVGSYEATVIIKNSGGTTMGSKKATLNINKINIKITANNKEKFFGQEDGSISYTQSGTLGIGDSIEGLLTREAGANAGEYRILQGTLDIKRGSVSTIGNYNFIFIP